MARDPDFRWEDCAEGWRTCTTHVKCGKKRANKKINLRWAGWTLEQYDAALVRQGGRCAVCGVLDGESLCADHDHATGRSRGLLCTSCNIGLGAFHDDPDRLRAAIEYLHGSSSREASDPHM